MPIEPITHLEKSIAGTVEPVTHLEKVISEYGGGGGGGGAVSSVNGKTGAVVLNAEDVGAAQESLKLTATPTAGPSGSTLMSGTWSGATWEEVAAAILASRLIQIDVANVGKITLLYYLDGATGASSNAFAYYVDGRLCDVFVKLGGNRIYLKIINARVETENVDGTILTIIPAANTVYQCGELTSLTISNPPATGKYSIIFYSGSTPTTTVGISNFAAEANKRYKITVEDNYATYDSWPYTPT